ncbi:MAG: transketolase [Janthinobacterium lividum]
MRDQGLELLSVNTIRMLSIDAVQKANSGHPGLPMGAASMAFVLWTRFLKHNPTDPLWPDRDRFVLSAGHGSAMLYSLLHLTGYDLPLDEIKRFRQWGSRTPGHPERSHHTPGVEVSTGPLGQGFANGVGMAMAEAWLAAHFNRPDHTLVDHRTYGIVSDGDLMEGITAEAASLAGHLQLGKLIYLYDQNDICLAGSTNLSFTEDVQARFESYGWHTRMVPDGNNLEDVDAAIREAQNAHDKPSLLLVRNHIGFGSPKKHDSFHAHGSPLGEEEVAATKTALSWPSQEPFFIPEQALTLFRQAIAAGGEAQQTWEQSLAAYAEAYPELGEEWNQTMGGKLRAAWKDNLPVWGPQDKPISTRVAGGQILNALAKAIPNLVGGSADLNPSTNTAIKDAGDFQPSAASLPVVQGAVGGAWDFSGRNIHFGIREHAMGAAVNGMAAHGGLFPYSATFMVFSDYMKPAMRLGALMGIKAVYVFTHDSIAVGEDGPTHEPIEQLAGLRAIPGLTVLRPADANEAREAWILAIERPTPTVLVLSRQNLNILERSKATNGLTERGAYVLADAEGGSPDVLLLGTGSEVDLCSQASVRLKELGVSTRVISMPSWEIFMEQSEKYQEAVLPKQLRKRVTVEAGTTFGWERFAGLDGEMIGIDQFGASASANEIMERFGFTVQHVTAAALRQMGRITDAAREMSLADAGDTAVAATSSTEGHS